MVWTSKIGPHFSISLFTLLADNIVLVFFGLCTLGVKYFFAYDLNKKLGRSINKDNHLYLGNSSDLIALHAWILEYICPFSGNPINIEAPIPEYWTIKFGRDIISQLYEQFFRFWKGYK